MFVSNDQMLTKSFINMNIYIKSLVLNKIKKISMHYHHCHSRLKQRKRSVEFGSSMYIQKLRTNSKASLSPINYNPSLYEVSRFFYNIICDCNIVGVLHDTWPHKREKLFERHVLEISPHPTTQAVPFYNSKQSIVPLQNRR